MYTILMNKDKSLVATVKTTIYQGESLVDKIQFLCPSVYEDFSLEKSKVMLRYVDQGNVAHCETLLVDDELYKGMVRYVLPLNTDLTRFAGTIRLTLTFECTDVEIQTKHVLHSGDISITILPRDVGFQLCDKENSDSDTDNDNNMGEDSTTEEEFKAVEF